MAALLDLYGADGLALEEPEFIGSACGGVDADGRLLISRAIDNARAGRPRRPEAKLGALVAGIPGGLWIEQRSLSDHFGADLRPGLEYGVATGSV